ncbi:universal stress protein [Ammonifex thiophilus]|uniref:universal stress protein n=1 Tax=Ammonifex thiophilus TaxID=444093 RepID=UPI001401CC37|nr:universal stress protein [Ammonifex thiophilus]
MPKCLVLVDGEDTARELASFVVRLVKANPELEVVLLYASPLRDAVPSLPGAGWLAQEEFERYFRLRADSALSEALAVFRIAGVGVRTLSLPEDPVAAVKRLVESESDYALVVVGDKGTDDRLHYVLSSEVYRLSHLLPLPLVVVKTRC